VKDNILVLNAGSSSIKFAVFDVDLNEQITGIAAAIGGDAELTVSNNTTNIDLPDHNAALNVILQTLAVHGIPPENMIAAAHRVVHGGAQLTQPERVTAQTLTKIANCTPLAPLHNPHNLAPIHALAKIAPKLAQFVSFDTAFHATNPAVATRYAIPKILETQGIRRYGFHGLSYASLVQNLPEISGEKLPRRLLAFHLGNGASLCAIKDGKSIATTMGYSPLDGLTMGTRAGGIDANAVLKLVEDHGLQRVKSILNNESGLLGLSGGKSDMRKLALDDAADSHFAIDHFCYWSLRHAGSLIAAMQGLDGVAFTGGIGENAANVRDQILQGLEWTGLVFDATENQQNAAALHRKNSPISAWIVPTQEERMIAQDALPLL